MPYALYIYILLLLIIIYYYYYLYTMNINVVRTYILIWHINIHWPIDSCSNWVSLKHELVKGLLIGDFP